MKHPAIAIKTVLTTLLHHSGCVHAGEVPYPLLNRDFVVVSDGIFSEEVKLNHVFLAIQFRMQLDVFYSQGAAAHGVSCLSFFFFITSSQGKLHLH